MKEASRYDLTKASRKRYSGICGSADDFKSHSDDLQRCGYVFCRRVCGGTAGVSAVSVCGPMMNVMIVTLSGMSAGVTVVIGLAGRKEKAVRDRRCGKYSVYPLLSDGCRGYRCRFLFAPQVLMLVQTPREAYDHALIYLRVMFLGIVFLFGYNLIGALQRGLGNSLSSLRYVVTAAVVNIALDYLLVGRLSMGTGGRGRGYGGGAGGIFFYGTGEFQTGGHVIRLRIRNMGDSAERHLKSILWFGIPTAFNEVMVNHGDADSERCSQFF